MVRYGKRNVGCRLPERSRQLRDTGYARGRGHEVRGEAEAGRQESESKRARERRDKRLEYVHAYRLLTLYFVSDPTGFVLPIRFRCPGL